MPHQHTKVSSFSAGECEDSQARLMTIQDQINDELARLRLLPLAQEQVECLNDQTRLEEAAGMLADLRDRCGVRLPLPAESPLGGPYETEDQAREEAHLRRGSFAVVTVDRMATDESRSTGIGDEYYAKGYDGADAALALADPDQWVALWVGGHERH